METNFREQLRDNRPYWKVIISLAISLIGTILFIYVGVRLLGFFMPFVVGWFIAYIASPLVNWLEKRLKIVKKLGSALIIILVLALVIFLIYFVGSRIWREVASLIQNMPDMYAELEKELDMVGKNLAGIFQMLPEGKPGGHFPDAAGRYPERMAGYHGRPGQIRGKSHGVFKRTDGDCSRQCGKKDSLLADQRHCHDHLCVLFHS